MRVIGFAVVLAVSLTMWPLNGAAQSRGIPLIGYLGNGNPPRTTSALPFSIGLRDLGWIEGQTVMIKFRWAKGNPDRLSALASELVQANVDVIVAAGPRAINAARAATLRFLSCSFTWRTPSPLASYRASPARAET